MVLELPYDTDLLLIIDALAMAASRHETSANVTKGKFRHKHDEKAKRMRELRALMTRRRS